MSEVPANHTGAPVVGTSPDASNTLAPNLLNRLVTRGRNAVSAAQQILNRKAFKRRGTTNP